MTTDLVPVTASPRIAPALLSYREAAKRMGCTDRHVRRLVAEGVLPAADTGRRHPNRKRVLGVPEGAVAAYVRGEDVSVPAPPAARRPKDQLAPNALHALAGVPEHIPILPGGAPDIEAMRYMPGTEDMIARYEERVHALALLSARLEAAGHGQAGTVYQQTAAETGHSARSLRRWKRETEEGGTA